MQLLYQVLPRARAGAVGNIIFPPAALPPPQAQTNLDRNATHALSRSSHQEIPSR